MGKGARGATSASTATNNGPNEDTALSKKLAASSGTGRGRRPAAVATSSSKENGSGVIMNGGLEQAGKLSNGRFSGASGDLKKEVRVNIFLLHVFHALWDFNDKTSFRREFFFKFLANRSFFSHSHRGIQRRQKSSTSTAEHTAFIPLPHMRRFAPKQCSVLESGN
jgi:hypothetical protein